MALREKRPTCTCPPFGLPPSPPPFPSLDGHLFGALVHACALQYLRQEAGRDREWRNAVREANTTSPNPIPPALSPVERSNAIKPKKPPTTRSIRCLSGVPLVPHPATTPLSAVPWSHASTCSCTAGVGALRSCSRRLHGILPRIPTSCADNASSHSTHGPRSECQPTAAIYYRKLRLLYIGFYFSHRATTPGSKGRRDPELGCIHAPYMIPRSSLHGH